MKKLLAITIAVAVLASLLIPASAFAKGAAPKAEPGNKYAILIGISHYLGEGDVLDYPEPGLDLFYADDDAMLAANTLNTVYGFDYANMTMLIDGAATREAILGAIASLKSQTVAGDEVVFHFSGHSFRPSDLGIPGPESRVGIMTYDLNLIWDYELKAAFTGFASKVVFIFDSCSSGSFSELAGLGRMIISATDQDGISGEFGPEYYFLLPEGYPLPPELEGVSNGLFSAAFYGTILGTWGYGYALPLEDAFAIASDAMSGVNAMAQAFGMPLDENPRMIDNIPGDFVP